MKVRRGEYPEHVYCLHCGVVSRILIVDVAVEKCHDDVEHWCAEAHFIAGLTAKHPDPFGFHGSFVVVASLCLLMLACPLLLDAFVQLEGRLLPVVRRSRRIGGRRESGSWLGKRTRSAIAIPRTTPCTFAVVSGSHLGGRELGPIRTAEEGLGIP